MSAIFTCLVFSFNLFFLFKEVWIDFQYVLIEVSRFEASHRDVQVRLHDRGYITLVYTEVERLNVVVVGENPLDFGLDEHVGDNCRQVISSDLLVQVERVGLLDDFHDLLELLQLAKRSLLLLHAARLFDCHFPGVFHRVINFHSEIFCWELF